MQLSQTITEVKSGGLCPRFPTASFLSTGRLHMCAGVVHVHVCARSFPFASEITGTGATGRPRATDEDLSY